MFLHYRKRGFTLLELIIVIIILGVLAGLALPRMMSLARGARGTAAINWVNSIHLRVQECLLAMGVDVVTFNQASDSGQLGSCMTYVINNGPTLKNWVMPGMNNDVTPNGYCYSFFPRPDLSPPANHLHWFYSNNASGDCTHNNGFGQSLTNSRVGVQYRGNGLFKALKYITP